MAIVICPECGYEISEHAEMCSNCGFPLQKFIEKNNITNIQGVLVCPKCASIYNGWYCKYELPQKLKCDYCNTILVQTDENTEEIFKLSCPKEKEQEFDNKSIELAKKFGNNQFSNDAFNFHKQKLHNDVVNWDEKHNKSQSAQQQTTNVPKCPKCGSTAITVGQRGYSFFTGFLGSNKTVNRCANCGHTWKPGK